MPIRGVIFDLGHTLMHLDATWPEVFEQGVTDLAAYLTSQQLGLDGEAFARAWLERRAEGFAQARETLHEVTAVDSIRWTFARFGLFDPDPALMSGAIDAFFAYEDTCWFADPDAPNVLRQLARQGLRQGMFSNASHDPFIQRLVERFGFQAWLDPALSSAGTGIRKPDPAAFGPILQAWELPAESVVMVGDTLDEDVLGAQQAGMHSVWIRSRKDARQEASNSKDTSQASRVVPDATIEHLTALPRCLAEL
jgi:HAD superfamily hydrolase (TIGR01549 family)